MFDLKASELAWLTAQAFAAGLTPGARQLLQAGVHETRKLRSIFPASIQSILLVCFLYNF
jgi:hypothetical protein